MAKDNKLAHLVAPRINTWRAALINRRDAAKRTDIFDILERELVSLHEIEQQVHSDLLGCVPDVPAPKDEVSVLLDLFQVATIKGNEHVCQELRRDIAKLFRQRT